MKLNVTIAKALMNLMPAEIHYLEKSFSENINHIDFRNAPETEKCELLLKMAERHYFESNRRHLDFFYPDYDLRKMLSGNTVLDFGCWCGGKTVSIAEKWNIKNMHGVDINNHFILAAKLFASTRLNNKINYIFKVGFGEDLPYESNFFDAIVSIDVFEHVQSLKNCLMECKRVLKPGGVLLAVFPSYYLPIGGAHLDLITNTPFLQWFFEPDTLNQAYDEIIESRGPSACWYKSSKKEICGDWRVLRGGIGINGTTIKSFKLIVDDLGFSQVKFFPNFILSGICPRTSAFASFIKYDFFQDRLSSRIASMLIK